MDGARLSNRLLRHDGLIVINEIRSALSSWTDRLLAVAFLLIVLVASHAALAHRPPVLVASAISVLAAIVGGGAARLIQRRLEFHAYDGVLASDGLAPRVRRGYSAAFHALVLGGTCVSVLAADPDLLAFGVAGYLAGAGVSGLANRAEMGRRPPLRPALARTMHTYLQRPSAGVAIAIAVLALLFPLGPVDAGSRAVLAGIIAAVAVLGLTTLDDAVIRFMTISGYRAWRIVGLRARGSLIFLAITGPAFLIASELRLATVVGGVVMAGLALMTARILAYRIHARRTADMVVGVGAVAVCIAGLAAPVLAPFITVASLWRLHRRSSVMTWMLA